MTDSAPPLWRVRLVVEDAAAEAMEAAIETALEAAPGDGVVSLARFEATARGTGRAGNGIRPDAPKLWRIEALAGSEPVLDALTVALAEAAGAAGFILPEFHVERLPDTDWLALNRRQFPPVRAGRFFVHGAHFEGAPPPDALVIRLDAGPAFGSGTHETTRGCLLALDEILSERKVAKPLDLGCGSGILSLAIARAAGVAVLASDIDMIAAVTARTNAAANGLDGLVTAVAEEGVGERVAAGAPYDLIVANILSEPLIALAPDIGAVFAPGGRLILSGLLTRQAQDVMAAYRAEGFSRIRAIVLGDWSTLVLARERDAVRTLTLRLRD